MKTEFRNRAFLPFVMPVGIVLGIAATVAGFAFILLYNSRWTAVVLATVMAAGILTAISLAVSQDRLDARRKTAVGLAGGVPVALGIAIALGLGGLPAEDLNINREPISVIPEDAPVIVATNAQTFESDLVRLPAGQEVTLVFDNQDEGVPHNWAMLTEEGGDLIATTETEDGPAELPVTIPPQEPGEYYFLCTIHPNMNGTVEVSEDIETAEVA